MQKVAKKSRRNRPDSYRDRRFRLAHAHEQSLRFVNTFLVEVVGRKACVVLFEAQIGAVFFAFIHYKSYFTEPGEKQGANKFFRDRSATL